MSAISLLVIGASVIISLNYEYISSERMFPLVIALSNSFWLISSFSSYIGNCGMGMGSGGDINSVMVSLKHPSDLRVVVSTGSVLFWIYWPNVSRISVNKCTWRSIFSERVFIALCNLRDSKMLVCSRRNVLWLIVH